MIAANLFVTVDAIKYHCKNIYKNFKSILKVNLSQNPSAEKYKAEFSSQN
ncbi:MAG: hypothetical protein H6613_06575 [Ignavibacteriales bacterium]|nr:hypothetical protein [Ignavibacteriales bacterium]